MAAARQQAEWVRVGALVSWVNVAVWAKKPVDPRKVIPAAFRPKRRPRRRQLTPEELASESRRAWKLMDSFFGPRGA